MTNDQRINIPLSIPADNTQNCVPMPFIATKETNTDHSDKPNQHGAQMGIIRTYTLKKYVLCTATLPPPPKKTPPQTPTNLSKKQNLVQNTEGTWCMGSTHPISLPAPDAGELVHISFEVWIFRFQKVAFPWACCEGVSPGTPTSFPLHGFSQPPPPPPIPTPPSPHDFTSININSWLTTN